MSEYLNTLVRFFEYFGKFLTAAAVEYPYVAAGVVIFIAMAFWVSRDKD